MGRDDDDIIIMRRDIPDLMKDRAFIDALDFWVDYKAFGDPYGKGYMNWPCQVYDVIRCFDSLYPRYKNDN